MIIHSNVYINEKEVEGFMEQRIEKYSKHTDYTYDIRVFIPDTPPPEEGFPVIYLLDGGWYFDLAKSVVRMQSRNKLKTKVQEAIVVGVGHFEETVRARRFLDFTAYAEQYIFPERTNGKNMSNMPYGGAEKFERFLMTELKPLIEEQFTINKKEQSLFGHSLAGYYTLWTYLNHTNTFKHYMAISPSIWWNDFELMKQLREVEESPTLMIAVGEGESFMVDEAQAFFEQLPNEQATFYIARDENHASVVPTVMSRAFRSSFNQ